MITVIIFLQSVQHLLCSDSQPGSQMLYIGSHLSTEFFSSDTANGSIIRQHTHIGDIIKFTEHAKLRELGYTRKKNKAQIRITCLQRTVKIAHHITQLRQIFLLMNHIKQRSVIFVYQDNHFFTGLLISTFYKSLQTLIHIQFLFYTSINLLVCHEFQFQFRVQLFPVHMFSGTHVEVQHRVLYPFLLQCLHGQSLKQILPSLEITVKGTGKQRFSKTSGPA